MLNRETVLFRSDRLIFVDPDDPSLPFWWPALIVPESEYQIFKETMDYDISAIKSNEQLVCYFEDGSFSIIPKSASIAFHPEREPFLSYVHSIKGFLNDEAIDRALKYRETGEIPTNFTWLRLLEFGYMTTLNRLSPSLNSNSHPFPPPSSLSKMKRKMKKREIGMEMVIGSGMGGDSNASTIIGNPSSDASETRMEMKVGIIKQRNHQFKQKENNSFIIENQFENDEFFPLVPSREKASFHSINPAINSNEIKSATLISIENDKNSNKNIKEKDEKAPCSNQEKKKKKGRKKMNLIKSPPSTNNSNTISTISSLTNGNNTCIINGIITQQSSSNALISKKESLSSRLDPRIFNRYQHIGYLIPPSHLEQLRENLIKNKELN